MPNALWVPELRCLRNILISYYKEEPLTITWLRFRWLTLWWSVYWVMARIYEKSCSLLLWRRFFPELWYSMSFVLHYKSFCWWHCLLVRVLCIWWSIIKERHLVTNIQEVINDSVSCWSLALRAQICIDQPSRLLLLQCLFFTWSKSCALAMCRNVWWSTWIKTLPTLCIKFIILKTSLYVVESPFYFLFGSTNNLLIIYPLLNCCWHSKNQYGIIQKNA